MIIIYFLYILVLNFLMLLLIYYTSKLTIKIHPIKIFFRGIFLFDWWYFCWLWNWTKKNPFAIFSVPVIVCLLLQIIEMGGLLMKVELFERTLWMSLRAPVLMGGIGGILYLSLKTLFPDQD
jgi:hypothetical protein